MAVYFGTPLAKKLGIQRKLSCGSRSLNDRDQFWRTFCGILPNKNIWSVFNRDNPQMSTPCGTSFPPRGILYFTPEFFYRICGVSLNATGAFIPLGELFVSMGILFFPLGKSFVAIEKIFPPGGNPLRDSGMLPSQPDSRQCACGTHSSGQSQCPAKILRRAFSRQSVGEFEPQAPTNGCAISVLRLIQLAGLAYFSYAPTRRCRRSTDNPACRSAPFRSATAISAKQGKRPGPSIFQLRVRVIPTLRWLGWFYRLPCRVMTVNSVVPTFANHEFCTRRPPFGQEASVGYLPMMPFIRYSQRQTPLLTRPANVCLLFQIRA